MTKLANRQYGATLETETGEGLRDVENYCFAVRGHQQQ